ncbi:MAG: hypothetical protein FWG68_11360 [Defluviitaleaceae bacterium]|nr:hypothetical protein [Defluviitaleaceae bacterium]
MKNRNKWDSSYVSIATHGTPGKCPFCNSENTDYFNLLVGEKSGFTEIFCKECHAFNTMSFPRLPKNHDFKMFTLEEYKIHQKERSLRLGLDSAEPQSTNFTFTEQPQPLPQPINA